MVGVTPRAYRRQYGETKQSRNTPSQCCGPVTQRSITRQAFTDGIIDEAGKERNLDICKWIEKS